MTWTKLSTVSSASTDWITLSASNLPHQMPSQLTVEAGEYGAVYWLVRSEPDPSYLAEHPWFFLDDPWVVKSDTPVLIASLSVM